MKFELTYYCGDGIYSTNVVYAANEEAARAWYEKVEKKPVIACCERVSPYVKPGMPIFTVPMTAAEINKKYHT